jgi:hypothetical protein
MLGQVDLSQIPSSFFDEVELHYVGGSLWRTSGTLGGTVGLNNSNGFSDKSKFTFEQSVCCFHSLFNQCRSEPENHNEVYSKRVEASAHFNGSSGKFNYKVFAEYVFTQTTNESNLARDEGNSGQQFIYIPNIQPMDFSKDLSEDITSPSR